MVVCDTQPGKEGKYDISVIVDGRTVSSCLASYGCTFTYGKASTPTLQAIVPNAANVGNNISFWGYTKVTNNSNVEMLFEDWRCNMLDQDLMDLNIYTTVFTTCMVGDLPAGKYPARYHNLINSGNSISFPGAIGYDENWNNFSFILVPAVTNLSSNSGSKNGQIITIIGTSFGYDTSKISIHLDSLPCKILNINAGSEITCELPSDTRSSNSGSYVGFSGLESRIWVPQQDIKTLRASSSYPNNANYISLLLSAESIPNKYHSFFCWHIIY